MDIHALNEAEVRTQYITPAIATTWTNWPAQVREEGPLTDGRIIVRGRLHTRGKRKFADYVLYHKPNIPLAVVEAKDANHSLGDGMQQALEYAEMLDVPFAFSSNGKRFLFHDKTVTVGNLEQELSLDDFPSPETLWQKYCAWKGLTPTETRIVEQPYHSDGGGHSPRYYQVQAINRTVEAIAKGQQRILLVMATGTGKTYTAMQIIWRLWKSGTKKRILFLADRNILVDQTKTNDFKPFGQAMTKIQKRQVDTAYEIYLALYQGLTGNEEYKNIFKQFKPDFFDLIIVDECHRGSAAEDSAWREVLTYFASATHIGLTATPKETKDVSNAHYFGEPVFTYSLKAGIQDGFLAPYKVVRVNIDRDMEGWRPSAGQKDDHGEEIADRVYNQRDMDRELVLKKRTELVAKKVITYLETVDPYAKTIVFCEDVDHAERMRQALANANPERAKEDRRYVMRITGDNEQGKQELDNFILPESRYPVIATTSRLMTTGVDAKTCKLIVLDRRIQSMTEFKQIIGRGSRIDEEHGKSWFTIMDFKKATELFADPTFDGEPVVIFTPDPDEPPIPPEDLDEKGPDDDGNPPDAELPPEEAGQRRRKYYVSDVGVRIVNERVQYLDAEGRLITESIKDYSRKKVQEQYDSLDTFLRQWSDHDKRQAILQALEERGLPLEALADEVGTAYSPFDLICHVAFGQPPLTRQERAEQVKKRDYFTRHGDKARSVLEALLAKYADEPPDDLADVQLLRVDPMAQLGTPLELIEAFGNKEAYQVAVRELEDELYA